MRASLLSDERVRQQPQGVRISNIYLAAAGSAGSTGGRGIKEHQYLQGYCQVREHVLWVGVRLFNIMSIISKQLRSVCGLVRLIDYNFHYVNIALGCFFVARFLMCVGCSSLAFVLWAGCCLRLRVKPAMTCALAAKDNVLQQGGQKT